MMVAARLPSAPPGPAAAREGERGREGESQRGREKGEEREGERKTVRDGGRVPARRTRAGGGSKRV